VAIRSRIICNVTVPPLYANLRGVTHRVRDDRGFFPWPLNDRGPFHHLVPFLDHDIGQDHDDYLVRAGLLNHICHPRVTFRYVRPLHVAEGYEKMIASSGVYVKMIFACAGPRSETDEWSLPSRELWLLSWPVSSPCVPVALQGFRPRAFFSWKTCPSLLVPCVSREGSLALGLRGRLKARKTRILHSG